MTDMPAEATMEAMQAHGHSPGVVLRSVVIGLTAFLTVVDLFATQAILPSLARHYGVTPGAMGFAVNASTIGMAVAGLMIGLFSPHIDRRQGILASLLCSRSRQACLRSRLILLSSRLFVSCRASAWLQPLRSRSPIWASSAARWMPEAPSPPISPETSLEHFPIWRNRKGFPYGANRDSP